MALISDHNHIRHGFDGDLRSGTGRARLDRTAGIRDWAFRTLRAWARRRSIRRTERALAQLDNRALRDLGLDRSMISVTARAAVDRQFGLPTRDDARR